MTTDDSDVRCWLKLTEYSSITGCWNEFLAERSEMSPSSTSIRGQSGLGDLWLETTSNGRGWVLLIESDSLSSPHFENSGDAAFSAALSHPNREAFIDPASTHFPVRQSLHGLPEYASNGVCITYSLPLSVGHMLADLRIIFTHHVHALSDLGSLTWLCRSFCGHSDVARRVLWLAGSKS